ncbi:MAG: hypothetical protein HXX14_19750 [Bacteroidetes bacterium]|nr:hypothetical protein [Bacteroidota bacterium]
MKKLKLKMQELTNPTILTHYEIKNIMGGSDGGVSGSSFKCKTNTSCLHYNSSTYSFTQGKCQQDSFWVSGVGYGCECSAGSSNDNCYA